MSQEIAVDVAILPPPALRQRAIELSAALPRDGSHDLVLDEDHLPHITLTQCFLRVDELGAAWDRVEEVLRAQAPLTLQVTGGGKGSSSLSMSIERTPAIVELHERLMEALRGFERPGGTPAAFFDGDARVADVLWVTGYRLGSSFGAFNPHITLGHGDQPPDIEPLTFVADTVGACHLGRYCSCRRVLRSWDLIG